MDSVKRRAPKKGYDNETKNEYREKVWDEMSLRVKPLLDADENARVLLLPSKEGIEIQVAISYGINPKQIIAIDENPALLAHAKWKNIIPKENRFGCKVSEVGAKIKKQGCYLVGANLDFCNTFSQELINEVNGFFDNTPLKRPFTFCITMGKGRESKALYLLLKHIESPDIFKHDRLAALYELTNFKGINVGLNFEDSYYSTFPMIYACFTIHGIHDSVFIKEKKRVDILSKRIRKLELYTISRESYGGKRRIDAIRRYINDIITGKYFTAGYYKENPPTEELKERTINDYKKELAIQLRYERQGIRYNDLQQKRSMMVWENKRMRSKEVLKVMDCISTWCENNNIIHKHKYWDNYETFFLRSKIRDGRLVK